MVDSLARIPTGKEMFIYTLTCLNSCNYNVNVINTKGTKYKEERIQDPEEKR
jgi:hypothetical protein